MAGSIRYGKVTAVYGSGHAVDVVLLSDGARYAHVQVLAAMASTNTGSVGLPTPTPPGDDYGAEDTGDRDIFCTVGFEAGAPIVLGFYLPQLCQMTFDRKNFRIDRHPSDVYTTVDDDGNVEVYHPSGTYMRIGTAPTHEDLTAQDFDKKFGITRNTDKAVHVHLSVKNAGVEKATLNIAPTGDIAVTTVGDLGVAVTGDITSSANQWNHTGDIDVTGTITGTVDVIGGGKSLKTHTHGSVTTGSGTTGAPV